MNVAKIEWRILNWLHDFYIKKAFRYIDQEHKSETYIKRALKIETHIIHVTNWKLRKFNTLHNPNRIKRGLYSSSPLFSLQFYKTISKRTCRGHPHAFWAGE